jgi:hypothetical protein
MSVFLHMCWIFSRRPRRRNMSYIFALPLSIVSSRSSTFDRFGSPFLPDLSFRVVSSGSCSRLVCLLLDICAAAFVVGILDLSILNIINHQASPYSRSMSGSSFSTNPSRSSSAPAPVDPRRSGAGCLVAFTLPPSWPFCTASQASTHS